MGAVCKCECVGVCVGALCGRALLVRAWVCCVGFSGSSEYGPMGLWAYGACGMWPRPEGIGPLRVPRFRSDIEALLSFKYGSGRAKPV